LAIIARKFQVGGDADPESTYVAFSANGGFPFQVNPAAGEELLNDKHSGPL
jgi:hypothetical protein